MPLTKTGRKVMSAMKKEYGEKQGKNVFYATAHKKDMEQKWEGTKKKLTWKSHVHTE